MSTDPLTVVAASKKSATVVSHEIQGVHSLTLEHTNIFGETEQVTAFFTPEELLQIRASIDSALGL